jgi:glycosyltransferase involved in cell wall biosynthesis
MNPSKLMRRRRVAHVSLGLAVGGQERLLVEFARLADRERFELVFISITDRGKLADSIEAAGWPVIALDMPSGLRPQIALRLAKLFRELDCDIVHTHDDKPLVYGSLAARLARVRHIHTQHHGVLPQMTARQRSLIAWAGRLPHSFVCVSRSSAVATADMGLPAGRIQVVWNGIDLKKNPYQGPSPQGATVTVARLSPEKDIATLLRATAIVVRACPGFRLEIAGDGDERPALEQLAASLQLQNHVKFLGEIHDIPRLLGRANLFVLSSRTEGVSLTILEAMACGLPVVATSVGGNPEVVTHERTGILVPAGDPEALATNLLWVAHHPREGKRMGHAGRERVEACFDCRRMVAQYERLYLGEGLATSVMENAIVSRGTQSKDADA